MLKSAAFSLLILALLPASAMAGPCDDGLKAVDDALASGTVPTDQRDQVKDMRTQAADLCKAGNEQEGLDVLTEVKAMLGLE